MSAVATDAVVVGSGPNGLAAAVVLARAGLAVELFEKHDAVGGAARTAELTEPGFWHDLGSAVHPMALASEFFEWFGLRERVEMRIPDAAYAHPLEDGRTGIASRDLARTAERLGRDGRAWAGLFGPLASDPTRLMGLIGGSPLAMVADPVELIRFVRRVAEQGTAARRLRFRDDVAPAMLAGLTAHAAGRLPHPARTGAGLVLGALAHAQGWPIPVGGSGAITAALHADFTAHGGVTRLGQEVRDIRDLPPARAVLLDVSAGAAARLAGSALPAGLRRRLEHFRYGAGSVKVDLATSAPIPWRDSELATASTIHLGGTFAQIAAAERAISRGSNPERAGFQLVSQPSLFDSGRAPAGRHVVWTYAHVTPGSSEDRAELLIDAIERHAPGFRDTILASHSTTASALEQWDANLPGGDIGAGAIDLRQLLARPRLSTRPWKLTEHGLYLSSSSVSPGPGVHGLAGWHAARLALREVFGLEVPDAGGGSRG